MLALVLLQSAEAVTRHLEPLQHITRTPCEPSAGDVVVCGGRPDRYRLPFPIEREAATGTTRADAGSGAAALTPAGRCGIFVGERRCGKAEAKAYGYGGGRDPVSVLAKLGTRLVDPDAAVEAK